MAVNAKIGLLLGLVFVFVLAFVLNSVHRSGDRKGNSDLTPVMVGGPPGIKPEIPPEALPPEPVSQGPARQTPAAEAGERYRTALPETAASEKSGKDIEPAKPAPPAVRYIVCEGDSLAYIARKFYGPEQGNKRANVLKIFEANRGVLKSPDEIDVGQELVIPPLEVAQPQKNAEQSIFPNSMFEKVESIGRKPL
jgi:nucleoid-associated protein YgaU